MKEQRVSDPRAIRSFRERRVAAGKGILALQHASGIHRARLSMIERGMMPNLAEHTAIELALRSWETPVVDEA